MRVSLHAKWSIRLVLRLFLIFVLISKMRITHDFKSYF